MHFFELERLFMQLGPLADALELPGRHVGEVVVVAQRLAVGRLTLFAEMPAARFAPIERIQGEQLRELEVVGDAAGVSRL